MNIDQLLQHHFGFDTFRAGQRDVIEQLLNPQNGRALAVFPTGAGKSLCYQLPALALEGTTVVVSPLIALMKDQIDFLRSHGIAAAHLDSSLSADESRTVLDDLASGALKLLYVAPERFNNERFVANLARAHVSLFAIDEAHCISEWGHNFRPEYLKLARAAHDLQVPRILALTATATPAVSQSICEAFEIPPAASINTGFYRPNLNLALTPSPAERREGLLLSRLQKRAPGATVVYVTLQRTAENIAARLAEAGLPARAYHAGLEAEDRAEIQDWWMAGNDRIVVATIAFGMGIDKSDVRYVYHFNLPKSLESYSQEIGRAGRDSLKSTCECFVCRDDVRTLENFAYGDTPTPEALLGLTTELMEAGEEFAVDIYALSGRHDIRQLVVKTALTYLELDGALRQGTPFYARYEFAPRATPDECAAAFPGEAGILMQKLFAYAKKGAKWYSLDADEAAVELRAERKHIVRAFELLEQKGLAEVRASQLRQRFYRETPGDAADLARGLYERFARREANEIARAAQVLELASHNGCQWNDLVAYFGEDRATPCGHCSFCVSGRAALPATTLADEPIDESLSDDIFPLVEENANALGHPRQLARFLCGLTSPATSAAKLPRHPLFGALSTHRFGAVLAWCEELLGE
jgi:ATP-dependent DNA helicase RecQ